MLLSYLVDCNDFKCYRVKIPSLKAFRKSGEAILETYKKRLVSRNLETQEVKDLGITGSMYSFVDPYIESLVLLGKPRTDMEWSLFSRLQRRDSELCLLLVHPRPAMAWNKVTQTPSLPMRLKSPPQPTPYQMP